MADKIAVTVEVSVKVIVIVGVFEDAVSVPVKVAEGVVEYVCVAEAV